VDFVNPTLETFEVFMKNVVLPKGQKIPTAPSTPIEFVQAVTYTVFSVFMDTIRKDQSRFADTSALFNDERQFDFRVDSFLPVEGLAQEILFKLKGFQNGN
jgi:hypothetical protein